MKTFGQGKCDTGVRTLASYQCSLGWISLMWCHILVKLVLFLLASFLFQTVFLMVPSLNGVEEVSLSVWATTKSLFISYFVHLFRLASACFIFKIAYLSPRYLDKASAWCASSVESPLSPLMICSQYPLSFHWAENDFHKEDAHILTQLVCYYHCARIP